MGIETMDDVQPWLDSSDKVERNNHYIASVERILKSIQFSRENDPKKEKISSRWDYPQAQEDLDTCIRFFQLDPSVSWEAFREAEQRLTKKGILPDGWEEAERARLNALWVPEAEQTGMIVREKVVRIHPKT